MDSGDGASDKSVDPPIPDPAKTNPIFKLPFEVRLQLYKCFDNPLRSSFRLVSTDLCTDIDTTIGPVNPLRLKPKAQTPAEILDFLQASVFQGIEINVPASEFAFEDILTSPKSLRRIKFEPNGILSGQFAHSLLVNCPSVSDIIWKGSLAEGISIPEINGRTVYLKLKKLTFQNEKKVPWFIFLPPGFDFRSEMRYTYTILDRIFAPSLNFIKMQLYSMGEDWTIRNVLNFLKVHPWVETIMIQIENKGDCEDTSPLTPLTDEEKEIFKRWKTKYFGIDNYHCSKLNHELKWAELIDCLNNVQHLKFGTCHGNAFSSGHNFPLTGNPALVKSLHVSGMFNNNSPFNLPLEQLPNLKVLIVRVDTLKNITPVFFEASEQTIANLEVLILQYYILQPEIFDTVLQLKNLKHLGILGTNGAMNGRYVVNVRYDQFVRIFQMRSLQSLLIPTLLNGYRTVGAVEKEAFVALKPYLDSFRAKECRYGNLGGWSCGSLYDISEPTNRLGGWSYGSLYDISEPTNRLGGWSYGSLYDISEPTNRPFWKPFWKFGYDKTLVPIIGHLDIGLESYDDSFYE